MKLLLSGIYNVLNDFVWCELILLLPNHAHNSLVWSLGILKAKGEFLSHSMVFSLVTRGCLAMGA